ncbi:glycosyltransferase [Eubacterium sp. MSJ-33]|uniref:glycosyltransferase n=1 Tax=Eubacterium sp. MSJ-33 TaxID=2841528 RepID=UPI001C77C13D|nr:glycosyltransferase [Eubacterium sp. MSJ-33]QWT51879.1 glycosyltransferase [Eubacterium sp. MSJ-33]
MEKHALLIANSASMIDHFNKDNIRILQEMGYTLSVAANFQEGNSSTAERIHAFSSELAEQDIEIIDLPIPRKVTELGKAFKSIRILKRYMRNHPCQIVHTQTPFGGVVGRLAAKKFRGQDGTKVIYFVHGFHFYHGAGLKNYLIYYNVEKKLSHITDCLITLNQEDYQAARQKFHHPNVHYVPGVGVDTDAIASIQVDKQEVCRRFGLPSGKRIILTVAELIPRKNVATAIRAFAASNHTDTILVICGKGTLMDSLSQLAEELGVRDRVFFPGYHTDVLDLYRCADLFLFTSFQEGLSVAVMQAMAAGLPIIASDIRGDRDLLAAEPHTRSKHYLLPPKAVDRYAEKIDEILRDPNLAHTLGAENQAMCKKYFDIALVHQLMAQIYTDLSV